MDSCGGEQRRAVLKRRKAKAAKNGSRAKRRKEATANDVVEQSEILAMAREILVENDRSMVDNSRKGWIFVYYLVG